MFDGFKSDHEISQEFGYVNDYVNAIIDEYENIKITRLMDGLCLAAPIYQFMSKEKFDVFVNALRYSNESVYYERIDGKNQTETFRM